MHTEEGPIRDVSYAGMVTRYMVDLEAGELQVVRQNLETTSAGGLEQRGRKVTIGWRPEQTVAVRTATRGGRKVSGAKSCNPAWVPAADRRRAGRRHVA